MASENVFFEQAVLSGEPAALTPRSPTPHPRAGCPGSAATLMNAPVPRAPSSPNNAVHPRFQIDPPTGRRHLPDGNHSISGQIEQGARRITRRADTLGHGSWILHCEGVSTTRITADPPAPNVLRHRTRFHAEPGRAVKGPRRPVGANAGQRGHIEHAAQSAVVPFGRCRLPLIHPESLGTGTNPA